MFAGQYGIETQGNSSFVMTIPGNHDLMKVCMNNNLKNNLKKNGIKFCIKIKEITSEIMLQLAISATIFLVICFVLNVWTIISYRKYRSRVASVTIYQSIEMKLTTYTIITLIGHILLDVHLVSLNKNNSDHLLTVKKQKL